jgi:hypothetical protein
MHKPKSIKDLLASGGKRVAALKAQTEERALARAHVCAALPENLAAAVVSAGVEDGRLTIGVAGAPWAARLRYVTETLRMRVSSSMGVDIESVRIKVLPPRV